MKDFIEKIASESPTPGGGSVAALASALGSALAEMVSRISLKKDDSEELSRILQRSGELRMRLLQLVEEDADSYLAVVEAFKLPRGTEEEKELREKSVRDALIGATNPPREVMDVSIEVLRLASRLAEVGSASTSSDAGVGALMAYAGLHGGYLNVMVNALSIKDEAYRSRIESEVHPVLEEGHALLDSALKMVDSRLQLQ